MLTGWSAGTWADETPCAARPEVPFHVVSLLWQSGQRDKGEDSGWGPGRAWRTTTGIGCVEVTFESPLLSGIKATFQSETCSALTTVGACTEVQPDASSNFDKLQIRFSLMSAAVLYIGVVRTFPRCSAYPLGS